MTSEQRSALGELGRAIAQMQHAWMEATLCATRYPGEDDAMIDRERHALGQASRRIAAALYRLDNRERQMKESGRESLADTIASLVERYGGIDGEHHKQWLLDQILRIVFGEGYAAWVQRFNDYRNPACDSYDPWDVGLPP